MGFKTFHFGRDEAHIGEIRYDLVEHEGHTYLVGDEGDRVLKVIRDTRGTDLQGEHSSAVEITRRDIIEAVFKRYQQQINSFRDE